MRCNFRVFRRRSPEKAHLNYHLGGFDMARNDNRQKNMGNITGKRLKEILKKKRITQKALAEAAGWSAVQMSRVASGEQQISQRMLQEIVEYLDEQLPEYVSIPVNETVHYDELAEIDKAKAKVGTFPRVFDKDEFPGEEYDLYVVPRGEKKVRAYLNPEYLKGTSDEMYILGSDTIQQEEDSASQGTRLMEAICGVLRLYGYDIRYTGLPYPLLSRPDFESEIAQQAEYLPAAQISIVKEDTKVELTPSEFHCLFGSYIRAMKMLTDSVIYEKSVSKYFKKK